MKLSVRITSLVLCVVMLLGLCAVTMTAAPASVTGTVKTDSAPIKIEGKETGATLTQYLLESGSKYSTAADGLVSVVELELSKQLTMAVLNGGDYNWTKGTMGANVAAYNKTHTDGTVIAAINGDPWIVHHTDYDGDGKKATGPAVKHVSVSRGTCIIGGELWATHQIDDENNLARDDNVERGTGASRGPVFAIKADGTAMIGQPTINIAMKNTTTNTSVTANGINRLPAPNSIILYNQRCGTESFALEDAYEVYLECSDSALRIGKATTGKVTHIFKSGDKATRPAITEKTVIISARGNAINRVTDKFKVGDTVTLTPNVINDMMTSNQKTQWADVTEAMAGFFTLVQKGNPTGQPGNNTHYPCTILGLTKEGKVIMVSTTATVDGTRNACKMTNLPALCKELGLHTAILMDGGGSTTMVTLSGDKYVRRSSAVDGNNSVRSVIVGMGVIYKGIDKDYTNNETKGTMTLTGIGLSAPEAPDTDGADLKTAPSYAYGYLAQVESINGVAYENLVGKRDPAYSSSMSTEEKLAAIQPAVVPELMLTENGSLTLSGWAQVNGGQGKHYWSVDKEHWYECVGGSFTDAEQAILDKATGEGNMKLPSATNGRFADLTVNLAEEEGDSFTLYVAVAAAGNAEKLLHYLTVEKVVRYTEETTEEPTEVPTEEPTEVPTEEPTEEPTEVPTEEPTEKPTEEPTEEPTAAPTEESLTDEVNGETRPDSGCGGLIGISSLALMMTVAAAAVIRKRED